MLEIGKIYQFVIYDRREEIISGRSHFLEFGKPGFPRRFRAGQNRVGALMVFAWPPDFSGKRFSLCPGQVIPNAVFLKLGEQAFIIAGFSRKNAAFCNASIALVCALFSRCSSANC